jgi:RNA polymerase sigma-70 factor (ECF subfamily)
MKRDDYTSMGGKAEAFLTTHWSIFEGSDSADEADSRALTGLLLNRYWKPVYCYLRRHGYDNEQAKDLTQSFFHEVVLERDLVDKADPAKGRFRSFLLMALNRYLANVRKSQERQRRTPKGGLVSLEIVEPPELSQLVDKSNPEDCFNLAWVSGFLEQSLQDVESRCREDGTIVYWHVFCDRVLEPIMNRADPASLKDICVKYGIDDEAKASNMIVTVKRRFQTVLREHVRKSVVSDQQAVEELEELRRFFPRIAQESK